MTNAETDLEICAREPIHIPGAIQSHGMLFGLDQSHFITHVSANAGDPFGREGIALLGSNFELLLTDRSRKLFDAALDTEDDLTTINPIRLQFAGSNGPLSVDLILHQTDQALIVEVEPANNEELSFSSSFHRMRAATSRLNRATTLKSFTDALASEIAGISGFDRVMVYRFDAGWNGEVIAESVAAGFEPLIGLHYPHTDIPAQARALYTTNWLRIIGDVNYVPTPLISKASGGRSSEPLDLSLSVLRSVSPVHIQYLKNMGVSASMSVSLVLEGKLWGLVACHNYTGPRLLPYAVRSAIEFLGQSASLLISTKEDADTRFDRLAVQSVSTSLHEAIADPKNDVVAALTRFQPTALDLVGASGFAVCDKGVITSIGSTPSSDLLSDITTFIKRSKAWPYSTDRLSLEAEKFTDIANDVSGVLAYETGPNSWVMWFRPEAVTTVRWAGDPTEKTTIHDASGNTKLGPRQSFASWSQEQRGVALRWQSFEVEAAADIARRVSNEVLLQSQLALTESQALQSTLVKIELPEIDGITFAYRYQPSRGRQIGGDWYDAIHMPSGDLYLSLGDVAGHGLGAASTMAQLRSGLRAYWVEGMETAVALSHLNALVNLLMPSHIATGVVAAVSSDRRTLRLASAGHPPVLFIRNGESSIITPPRAPALGVAENIPYKHIDIALQPGDMFMLYTDGLIEGRDRSLDEGIALMASIAAAAKPGNNLEPFCDTMINDVPSRYNDDDIAIFVVRIDS